MNKKLLILIAIGLVFFLRKEVLVTPVFDSPLSTYVFEKTATLDNKEKAVVARCFRSVYEDIKKLADPLFIPEYKLAYPQDAVNRVKQLIEDSLPNHSQSESHYLTCKWCRFLKDLSNYIEEHDNIDGDNNHPDRTIYSIGEQFRVIADGLDPQLRTEQPELLGDTSEDIEKMYLDGDIIGVFLDEPGQPQYIRKIAREDEQVFDAVSSSIDFGKFPLMAGEGKGKQAVYWNYAYRFGGDIKPFSVKQITGNCVFAAAGDTIITNLLGVNVFLYGRPLEYEGPGSTSMYAFRGHGGQGSTTGRAASAYLQYGYPVRKDYGGSFDLRDTVTDQKVGINNWRDPQKSLAPLLEELKNSPIGKIEKLESGFTQEYVMDALYMGCSIHFGGTLIGDTNGNPISSLGRVGPHSMACIGYCDTQQFKDWYKEKTGKTLTEAVFFFDNTWGEGPQYIKSNWPTHLFGRQTAGMYILTWSDTKKILNSAYVWYPRGMKGKTPEMVDYRLSQAKIL